MGGEGKGELLMVSVCQGLKGGLVIRRLVGRKRGGSVCGQTPRGKSGGVVVGLGGSSSVSLLRGPIKLRVL